MFDLASHPEMLLNVDSVDSVRRPRLAAMLEIFPGNAWLLSEENISDDPTQTRMLILIADGENVGLIDDTAADSELRSEESYHMTNLNEQALASVSALLAIPQARVRKESTGRPPKYSAEREGASIFIQHVYEGMSIKKLANEYDMSPTTVQKLLNQARLTAARKLLSGEWQLSKDSPNYQKNLEVMRWAVEHTKGEEQQNLKMFLTFT